MENSKKRVRISEGQLKLFKRYKKDVFPTGVDEMVAQELALYKVLLSDITHPYYSYISDDEDYVYRRGHIFVNLLTGTGYVTTKHDEDIYLISMSASTGSYPLLLEEARRLFPDSIYRLYGVRENLNDELGDIVTYSKNEPGVIVSCAGYRRHIYLFKSKKIVVDQEPEWKL